METLQTTPGYDQSGLAVAMQFARPMTQETQMMTECSLKKGQPLMIEDSPYGNVAEIDFHHSTG